MNDANDVNPTHDPINQLTCAECGYALRGLNHDANCPECGHRVAASLSRAKGLTKRELAELACRVLALWLMVMALDSLVGMALWIVLSLTNLLAGASIVPVADMGYVLLALIPAIVQAGSGVAIWLCAPWLATKMIRQDGAVAREMPLRKKGLMVVIFTAMGLYLLATGAGQFVAMLTQGFVADNIFSERAFGSIWGPLARAAIGLWLLLGATGITRFITRPAAENILNIIK